MDAMHALTDKRMLQLRSHSQVSTRDQRKPTIAPFATRSKTSSCFESGPRTPVNLKWCSSRWLFTYPRDSSRGMKKATVLSMGSHVSAFVARDTGRIRR